VWNDGPEEDNSDDRAEHKEKWQKRIGYEKFLACDNLQKVVLIIPTAPINAVIVKEKIVPGESYNTEIGAKSADNCPHMMTNE
jgi:hypothetical protein